MRKILMVAAAFLMLSGVITPAAAEEKSADEIARELNNPNNDLAKLAFKNQFRWYTGDLPGADDQNNYTMLFQPIFPFSLGQTESGDKKTLFIRPAIPVAVQQPYFDVSKLDFGDKSGLGDIGFDLALGITKKTGWVFAGGMVGTLPTGTSDELTGGQLRLGPEFLIGHVSEWGLVGAFPSHQWDVTGWKDGDFSTSSLQVFAMHTAGGGWVYGTQPTMTYNWETKNWTIPIQAYISKTVIMGKTPVKLDFELNYYVKQEDQFGPEWMVGFNITPVVPNFIEQAIRGK